MDKDTEVVLCGIMKYDLAYCAVKDFKDPNIISLDIMSQDTKERVKLEIKELGTKIAKLSKYIETKLKVNETKEPGVLLILLQEQLKLMQKYETALDVRIQIMDIMEKLMEEDNNEG